MTATEPGPALTTCPLCGDYEGPPSSVEGHISAMNDDAHSGHFGAEFRPEIEKAVDSGSSDGVVTEGAEAVDSEGGRIPDLSDPEGDDAVDSGSSEAVDGEGAEAVDSEGGSSPTASSPSGGIPIPVSSTTLMVAVGVFFLLAVSGVLSFPGLTDSSSSSNSSGGSGTAMMGDFEGAD